MSKEIEIWKPLIYKGVDYTGYYEVSNLARIKSLVRKVSFGKGFYRVLTERILKNSLMPNGYHSLGINKNGSHITLGVARAVATMFVPNPENKPEVNHIDGNKLNNLPVNLEWVTRKENVQHAWATGLKVSNNRKLKEYEVVEIIKRSLNGERPKSISKDYGVCPENIYCIMANKSWKHLERK